LEAFRSRPIFGGRLPVSARVVVRHDHRRHSSLRSSA
jgi:hypothetical protein